MKNSVKAFVKPILTLMLVCLVCTLCLALTNSLTAPLIQEAEAKAEKEALREVCADAENFTALDLSEHPDFAKTVTGVYATDLANTYVFRLETSGYASGIKILVAIGNGGKIVGISTLSTNETDGYGKRCESSDYTDQYVGVGAALDGVDALSGATKTTKAYEGAVKDAFSAYAILIQGGAD